MKKIIIFLTLALSVCAFAQIKITPTGEVDDNGTPYVVLEPTPYRVDNFVCYTGEAGFIIYPPKGWLNDSEAAAEFGLCAILVPEGTDLHSAPAVMYPGTVPNPGGTLEQSAKKVAEKVVKDFTEAGLKAPKIRQGKAIKGENTLMLWYFDDGPPPNNWEASAYLPFNEGMLMLVLSSYTKESRDKAISALEDMAKGVKTVVTTPEKIKELQKEYGK